MKTLDFVRKERIVFFSFIAFILLVIGVFTAICKGSDIIVKPEEAQTLSDSWQLNHSDKYIKLPEKVKIPKKGSISLSCILPQEDYTGKALAFSCSYMGCKVYIDDEVIWTFSEKPTMPFGNMRGSANAIVPLKDSYAGKKLTIEYINLYNEINSDLEDIRYGSEGEIKFALLYHNVWRVGFYCTLLSLAFVSFLMGVSHIRVFRHERNMSFVYFAALSCSVATWIIVDPAIVQYFSNKTTVSQFVSFASLICVGTFYMGLCSSFFNKHRRFYDITKIVGYVLLVCMVLCYVLSIADPTSFMYIIFAYAFVTLIAATVYNIIYYKYYDFSNLLLCGTGLLLIGIASAVISFLRNPLRNNCVVFFSVSYGLYIFILFLVVLRDENKMLVASAESENNERMAYSDFLTGINNRAALERDIATLTKRAGERLKAELFIGDLNFLKWTNDNLGHAKGDQLIVEAAACLKRSYGEIGKVYRLGGDEFAVLIINGWMSREELEKILAKEIQKTKEEKDISISIAMGYAQCNFPMENPQLEQVLYYVADKDMYRAKQEMKAQR